MKHLSLAVLIISLFTNLGYSQNNLKRVKGSVGIGKEVYSVLEDNPSVKQGDYEYTYDNDIFIRGQYDHDLKSGNWKYQNDKAFTINAYYSDGKSDSLWSYYDGGVLRSEVRFKNGKREGLATGYYKNGAINSIVPYRDGKIDGTKKVFYDDGVLKFEVDYKDGILSGSVKHYDRHGNLSFHVVYANGRPNSIEKLDASDSSYYSGNLRRGTGFVKIYARNFNTDSVYVKSEQEYENGQLSGKCVEYGYNGKILYFGYFKNNFMVGQWHFFNTNNPKVHAVKVYSLSDSITTDSTNMYSLTPTFFSAINLTLPRFQGKSVDNFRSYIAKSLVYPEESQANGITGKVYIKFNIDITGKVVDVKLIKSGDKNLDGEAIRIVELSPNWIPGFEENIPAKVSYTVPISFVLQ